MQAAEAAAKPTSFPVYCGVCSWLYCSDDYCSIAWYNSKRPVGWENKERPDVVPEERRRYWRAEVLNIIV